MIILYHFEPTQHNKGSGLWGLEDIRHLGSIFWDPLGKQSFCSIIYAGKSVEKRSISFHFQSKRVPVSMKKPGTWSEHAGDRIPPITRRMVFCETFQGENCWPKVLRVHGPHLCFSFLWVPSPAQKKAIHPSDQAVGNSL